MFPPYEDENANKYEDENHAQEIRKTSHGFYQSLCLPLPSLIRLTTGRIPQVGEVVKRLQWSRRLRFRLRSQLR